MQTKKQDTDKEIRSMTDPQLEAFIDYKTAMYKLEIARKELRDAKWAFDYVMGDEFPDLEQDIKMDIQCKLKNTAH